MRSVEGGREAAILSNATSLPTTAGLSPLAVGLSMAAQRRNRKPRDKPLVSIQLWMPGSRIDNTNVKVPSGFGLACEELRLDVHRSGSVESPHRLVIGTVMYFAPPVRIVIISAFSSETSKCPTE